MSVHVHLIGRLGNNLFQYAFARIVAEHHGFELICECNRSNKGDTLASLAPCFPRAPLHVAGRRFTSPLQEFDIRSNPDWGGQTVDLAAILNDPAPRSIHLHGYFQRIEYFAAHRERIRTWFQIEAPDEMPFAVNSRDVLLNIRRGADFGLCGCMLSLTYYDTVLSQLSGIGRIFITGVGIDAKVRRHFEKYDPVYYDAEPLQHFLFFRRFRRIVLSNSTFAWWGGYLSDAEELYAPHAPNPDAYSFTGFKDVDLHMPESRYKQVNGTSVVPFGIVRPNKPAGEYAISACGRNFLIRQRGGPAVLLEGTDANRILIDRVLRRREAITVQDQRQKSTSHFLIAGTLRELVKCGLISFELEDAENGLESRL